jgi:glycosyltransferase involved in cell wall biosynthesis
MIDNINKIAIIKEYRVPCQGSMPWNIIRNICFVRRHRNKKGINHITGDIHYCILGLIGCKSVLTIHDDYAIKKAHRGILDKICKWLFWIYLPVKLADEVICISESTKKKIERLTKERRIKILTHHVVDTGFNHAPKEFNEDCPTILQIGVASHKNLETTLHAIKDIKCNLRVVKQMTRKQHLLAQSLNVNYCNVFNLTDEEVINEYIKSDIIVFPSLYEGFGLPIIEGQAVGRVVVTSDIEPMNWVAGDGALLLNNPMDRREYKQALCKVITDSIYRESLIRKGLENVQRFTVENATKQYMDIYKEVLNESLD